MGEQLVNCHYQAYFCEENIWHLAQRVSGSVFVVSNQRKTVALWSQKLGRANTLISGQTTEPVIWDYHVILAANDLLYDFDSDLPFPCPARTYFEETFRPFDTQIPEQWRPKFRRLSTGSYAECFHSDRSHMKNAIGEWTALPPDWPPIINRSLSARSMMKLLDFQDHHPEEISSLQERMEDLLLA